MKIYLIFTKRILLAIFCIMIITVCILSQFFDVAAFVQKNGDTHKTRTDFLASLGCSVYDEVATEKQIIIPIDFGDVYENYNSLQKQAGYDLSLYKGEECKVFSYRVKSFADFSKSDYATANLIVYNGRIIGGDISSTKINGKMYPLSNEKTKT